MILSGVSRRVAIAAFLSGEDDRQQGTFRKELCQRAVRAAAVACSFYEWALDRQVAVLPSSGKRRI
ncbi:MAG: hypothetical protein C4293_22645 [Nitrospiraceae bacterium]